MKDSLIVQIAKEVRSSDSKSVSYDTWGDPDRSNIFHNLKFHFTDKGINAFEVYDDIYIVEFRNGNNITSMGGSPDDINVKLIAIWKERF